MNIRKISTGGGTEFLLDGKLDAGTAPELHAELMEELKTVKNVTLDFAKLTYISSAGLRVLALGEKEAKAGGGQMTLRDVPDKVMEILTMTGFRKILTFE